MPASEARINANQANSKLSTRPQDPNRRQGKVASQNSYKHGLSGGGVVVSVDDAAEVAPIAAAYRHRGAECLRRDQRGPGPPDAAISVRLDRAR